MSTSPPHCEESQKAQSTEGSGHAQNFVVHLNPGVNNPYGFRIYRTTYDSEEEWDQFMAYFKAQAQRSLVENELGEYAHLRDEVDYTVQSSPDLDGITFREVRTHFLQWLTSGEEQPENCARYLACIAVDSECLESVLTTIKYNKEEGLSLDEYDDNNIAYVQLISARESESTVSVAVGCLYPRVFKMVHDMGWEFIQPDEGEWVANP